MDEQDRQGAADRLAPVAVELADRVRHDDPDTLAVELLAGLTAADLWTLVFLLAAAADTSVSPEVWWGWARYRAELEAAEKITWEVEDEPTVDPPTSAEINQRIKELAEQRRWTVQEIAWQVGLTREATGKRMRGLGVKSLPRGDARTARQRAQREAA